MRKWSVRYVGPNPMVIAAGNSLEAEMDAAERAYERWVAEEIEDVVPFSASDNADGGGIVDDAPSLQRRNK